MPAWPETNLETSLGPYPCLLRGVLPRGDQIQPDHDPPVPVPGLFEKARSLQGLSGRQPHKPHPLSPFQPYPLHPESPAGGSPPAPYLLGSCRTLPPSLLLLRRHRHHGFPENRQDLHAGGPFGRRSLPGGDLPRRPGPALPKRRDLPLPREGAPSRPRDRRIFLGEGLGLFPPSAGPLRSGFFDPRLRNLRALGLALRGAGVPSHPSRRRTPRLEPLPHGPGNRDSWPIPCRASRTLP